MDTNGITQIVGSLGFPIVCVLGLAWFIYHVYTNYSKQSEAREEKLYEVVAKCQEQLAMAQETNEKFVDVLQQHKEDLQTIKEDVEEIKGKLK